MSNHDAPSRGYRFIAALFELIEGRRSVPSTVRELQQSLRGNEVALDEFLEGLERQTLTEWTASLAETAARVRAASEQRPAEQGAASSGERPPAPVVHHPSSRNRGVPPEPSDRMIRRSAHDYSAAFTAVAARGVADAERVAAERTRAAREIKRLMGIRSPRQRAEAIATSRRPATRSPLLVVGLIEEACRVRGASPRVALELTEAAMQASHRTHPRHGRSCVWRLQKRAEAHHANVLRLLGELPAADAFWRRINEHIAVEPIDVPDEEAELLSLEASLRIDLRQFERAEILLERAERLCRELEDWFGVARVLLMRGCTSFHAGEPERAAEFERRAVELTDPGVDSRLYLMCRQNLAATLIDLDRAAEAAVLLAADSHLVQQVDDPSFTLRSRWIEARTARALQRLDEAERLFLEVRNGWLSMQRPYDAALATLDLAELGLIRGDWQQVKRQVKLLAPIFESRGVHREAKAALILLQQSANAERLTAEFVLRLRRYLHFAPRDSRLRFDPQHAPAAR